LRRRRLAPARGRALGRSGDRRARGLRRSGRPRARGGRRPRGDGGLVQVSPRDAAGSSPTGTAALPFPATSSTGITATAAVELRFSDDLARNDAGAPWPAPFASSNQAAYPAYLAFDGNGTSFWVSAGTEAGQGPSAAAPAYVGVDLGAPTRIGSVTMVPRVNYGPRAYTVEISDDAAAWRELAAVPSAANATVRTSFSPVTARAVRLRITDGYDRIRPARNVQVSSLEVRAP
jgi:hypothetical protein